VDGSNKFYILFGKFVSALKNAGEDRYDENAIKAQNTQWYNAYWAFMEIKDSEVKEVQRSKHKDVRR